jgi:hypothetical membrane protein
MSTPGTLSPSGLAVGGFAAFALSVPLAGAFHPDYSHLREGISALAAINSPAAPIMIAGFLALALGTAATGVALWVRLPVGVAGRIGAALVVLAGLGMVVVGLNQQDCSELIGACAAAEAAGTLSDHHVVHQLVSLAVFLVLIIAMFPLARGLRRNGGPAGLAVATRLIGVFGTLVIAAMMTVGLGDLGGLVQRLFIALLFGAPVVLGCRSGRPRARWAVTEAPVGKSR